MARILIIHPDPTVLRPLNRLLVQEGHSVDAAMSGFGALALIRRTPPDLVLLELLLPDMDGAEFIERVREEGYEDLPVLLIPAAETSPGPGESMRGPGAGPIRFDPQQLLATIRQHLYPADRD